MAYCHIVYPKCLEDGKGRGTGAQSLQEHAFTPTAKAPPRSFSFSPGPQPVEGGCLHVGSVFLLQLCSQDKPSQPCERHVSVVILNPITIIVLAVTLGQACGAADAQFVRLHDIRYGLIVNKVVFVLTQCTSIIVCKRTQIKKMLL